MRTSLAMRAAAASAAALLFLSPGLEAALAHSQTSFSGPVLRTGFVHNHGFAPGFRGSGRGPSAWRGQYGRNRYGGAGWFWNGGGLYGGGFLYSPYGFVDAGGGSAGGGGTLVVVGAPAFSVFPGAAPGVADPSPEGGCVIHKLAYDSAGNYVGERQTPEC
jgi:hypothetical protein